MKQCPICGQKFESGDVCTSCGMVLIPVAGFIEENRDKGKDSNKENKKRSIGDRPRSRKKNPIEEPVIQDIPKVEEPITRDISKEEKPATQGIPKEEELLTQDVTKAEEPIIQDIPKEEMPLEEPAPQIIPEDIPVREVKTEPSSLPPKAQKKQAAPEASVDNYLNVYVPQPEPVPSKTDKQEGNSFNPLILVVVAVVVALIVVAVFFMIHG